MVQRINWVFSEAGNVEASQTLAMLIACDTHHLTAAFWQLPPPNALDTSVLNQPSERARNLSLYRRLMMRTLIGQYLHVSATEVLVDYHGNGGLRLLSPAVPLYLSVSQRGDVAGFAVSTMPVGIDVEIATPASPVPWNILSEAEGNYLRHLDDPLRHRAFLRIWTAKEAYLKAKQTGLLREPAEVSVTFDQQSGVHIADRDQPVAGITADCVEAFIAGHAVIATCLSLHEGVNEN
jgi:4'-phosphopantetheinyl transferase